jgi:hypothetical protein
MRVPTLEALLKDGGEDNAVKMVLGRDLLELNNIVLVAGNP